MMLANENDLKLDARSSVVNGPRSTRRFAIVWLAALLWCVVALCLTSRADEVFAPREETRPQQITIGGKTYKAHWIEGTYGASENYSVSRLDLAYIWDGQTAFAVDPLHARVLSTLPSKFPVLALSPDQSLALVKDKTDLALMDIALQQITVRFEKLKGFAQWNFSPDGKFIFPLSSNHGHNEYCYIDVAKNREVKVLLHAKRFVADPAISGVASHAEQELLIFSRAIDRIDWGMSDSKTLRLPFNDPSHTSIAKAPATLLALAATRNGKLLAWQRELRFSKKRPPDILSDKHYFAWLDAHTLNTLIRSPQTVSGNFFAVQLSPDGKEVYALDALDGLSIYRASTLELIANPKAGRTANAYSIGATFSEDGKFAYVTEPYKGSVHVIDVAARKVVETNDQLGQGIAGVLPIGDECFVITTLLPYE